MLCEDFAVRPDQTAAASAPGAPCLGVLCPVHYTLDFKKYTKLFHQTVDALSHRSCRTRRYTNVVYCFLKMSPSNLSPSVCYLRVNSLVLGGMTAIPPLPPLPTPLC